MPGPSTNTAARNITKKRVEFADRRIFKEPTESITQKSALPNEQELFDKLEEAYQVSKSILILIRLFRKNFDFKKRLRRFLSRTKN
jgi:hypothetical protein